jgi:hypothetical protein
VQENTSIQQEILRVVALAVRAASEHLADLKRTKLKEIYPANQSITDIPAAVALLGEGGEEGVLKPGTSTAFAVLEVQYNYSSSLAIRLKGKFNFLYLSPHLLIETFSALCCGNSVSDPDPI